MWYRGGGGGEPGHVGAPVNLKLKLNQDIPTIKKKMDYSGEEAKARVNTCIHIHMHARTRFYTLYCGQIVEVGNNMQKANLGGSIYGLIRRTVFPPPPPLVVQLLSQWDTPFCCSWTGTLMGYQNRNNNNDINYHHPDSPMILSLILYLLSLGGE